MIKFSLINNVTLQIFTTYLKEKSVNSLINKSSEEKRKSSKQYTQASKKSNNKNNCKHTLSDGVYLILSMMHHNSDLVRLKI